MKVKPDFLLSQVADAYVVVPVGHAAVDFGGMISLNETGAFLWKLLSEDVSEADMLAAMLAEYEIDRETAARHIASFVAKLKEADLLES